MADEWCDSKKGVWETDGIWWKDKEETFVSNVNIDGRNINKHENNSRALRIRRSMEFSLCFG